MPLWRFRLVARTHASHAWNTGSIPVGATLVRTFWVLFFFCLALIDNTCCSHPALHHYRGATCDCCCKCCRLTAFRKLPVRKNRPRTYHPERSEGSQTKGSLKNRETKSTISINANPEILRSVTLRSRMTKQRFVIDKFCSNRSNVA